MHLLLIEDDLDLGASLQQALRTSGYTSEWLRTAHDGRQFASLQHYDCMLLDLSLPDGDGMALLRRWRSTGMTTPVIIITASSGLADRLAGLDEGADDFIVKPFAVEEMISRLRAVTRRAAQQTSQIWQFGSLTIDLRRHEALLDEQPAGLSPREFQLLLTLARAAGSVVPKHRLAQALEPLGAGVDFNTLEVHVHNLRRKVGSDLIRTVRGVGYLMQR